VYLKYMTSVPYLYDQCTLLHSKQKKEKKRKKKKKNKSKESRESKERKEKKRKIKFPSASAVNR
jgi:hypothetical protein